MASIKKELQLTGKDISTVELLQTHDQTVRVVTCREDDVDFDIDKNKASSKKHIFSML
jgi:hypothetical protein